jgi:DNA-binding IclR family transcriptional regulator
MPEMEALTADLGQDCVASAAIHDEIVILARTGTPQPFGVNVLPGMRVPLVPPLGTVFVAWSGQDEIERWLARVGPSGEKHLDRHREAVEAVRSRGFSVAIAPGTETTRARMALEESVREIPDDYALIELDSSGSYMLRHIGAPVFGARGEVVIALFLFGFQRDVTAADIPAMADRLMVACRRISEAIDGRAPSKLVAAGS